MSVCDDNEFFDIMSKIDGEQYQDISNIESLIYVYTNQISSNEYYIHMLKKILNLEFTQEEISAINYNLIQELSQYVCGLYTEEMYDIEKHKTNVFNVLNYLVYGVHEKDMQIHNFAYSLPLLKKVKHLFNTNQNLSKAIYKNKLCEVDYKFMEFGVIDLIDTATQKQTLKHKRFDAFKKFFANNLKFDDHFVYLMIRTGCLNFLKYYCNHCREKQIELPYYLINSCAYNGHLIFLEYLDEIYHMWNDEYVMSKVVWSKASESAARGGQHECLKFLHEKGYEWDSYVCFAAADYGHLKCLQYAFENGCDCDGDILANIVMGVRNKDCVAYLQQFGY